MVINIKRFIGNLVMGILSIFLLYGLVNSLLSVRGAVAEADASPLILSEVTPQKREILPGGTAEFTVTVFNTGPVLLTQVSTTNSPFADCNRGDLGPLSPGASVSFDCDATGIPESTLNTIQANGVGGGSGVTHASNAYVKVLKPEISILRIPQTQTVVAGGTAVFNAVIVKNISGTTLTEVKVDDNVANDCDWTIPTTLEANQELNYPCVLNNVQSAQTSIISVEAEVLADGKLVKAGDASWVEALKLQATLTPAPASVPEPGDLITYVVNLVNNGSLELTLVSLTTVPYGNLLDSNNPLVDPAQNTCLTPSTPPVLPPFGGTYSCSFVAAVNGQPSNFNVNLTATAKDKNNKEVIGTATATVVITNLPASVNLSLSAEPPFIAPPSRPVTFKIQVENTSEADVLTITKLEDQFLGNLDGQGTCDLPVANLAPSQSYQCEFTAIVSGSAGEEKSRTITVTAVDDDLPPKTLVSSKVVTVSVTALPPQAIFFPNVTEDTVEPNAKCSEAYPLVLNRSYSFFPPATYPADQDYYSFELTVASRVKVELTNFAPQAGQILVRSGGDCAFIEGKNGTTALNKTVDLALKPAGKYYIQVINDNKSPGYSQMYTIIVRTY